MNKSNYLLEQRNKSRLNQIKYKDRDKDCLNGRHRVCSSDKLWEQLEWPIFHQPIKLMEWIMGKTNQIEGDMEAKWWPIIEFNQEQEE